MFNALSGNAQLIATAALGFVEGLVGARQHAVERIRRQDARDSARHADFHSRRDVRPVRGSDGATDPFDEAGSSALVRARKQQYEFLATKAADDIGLP